MPRYMWIQTMDPADQLNFAFDPLDPTKAGSRFSCWQTVELASDAAAQDLTCTCKTMHLQDSAPTCFLCCYC